MKCALHGLLLGFGVFGGSAWAQEPTRLQARLSYQLQPALRNECPDEKTFEQLVSARTGYVAFQKGSSNLLEVRISQNANTLQGLWKWQPEAGVVRVREFSGNRGDCLELLEQMVLATSVTFSPGVALILPTPDAAPEAQAVTPSPKPITWSVGAGMSLSSGLSQPALGVLVDGMRTREAWALGIETEWQGALATSLSPTASFQASLWRLGAKACRVVSAFQGCVLMSGGAFWADSRGLTSPTFVGAPLFRAGLSLGGEHALSSPDWAARWAVIGECQPTQWVLRVGADTVWESPWCSVGIRLQGVRRWSGGTP